MRFCRQHDGLCLMETRNLTPSSDVFDLQINHIAVTGYPPASISGGYHSNYFFSLSRPEICVINCFADRPDLLVWRISHLLASFISS